MRLQIDTVPAQDELIGELMELAGTTSKKELFNNALAFLAWGLNESAEGRKIASVDEAGGKYRELQMPVLMNAARNAKTKETSAKRKAVAAA